MLGLARLRQPVDVEICLTMFPARTKIAKGSWWVAAASLLFFIPAALLAWSTGPELPTLGAALIGALLFVWLVHRLAPAAGSNEPAVGGFELIKDRCRGG
jgi:L-lactate permease